MKKTFLSGLIILAMAPGLQAAEAKPNKPPIPTYLTEEDARKAGPDFDLQGEYAEYPIPRNRPNASAQPLGSKVAAQVIALGNDTFRAVFYKGGLPGMGWDRSAPIEIEAQRENERVQFAKDSWKASLTRGGLTGQNETGRFNLDKMRRGSPERGAKPPPGALVLFDGSNCDAWAGGHFDDLGRKLLAAGTKTKRDDFQNFTLHAEFLLPFKPLGRGQDRGNSGIYLQDRYEVQVLDSFGLKGENNECGGIYTRIKPAINMCFPPLVWQTYDIEFEAAKFDAEGKKVKNPMVTVRHNGVLIHDKVEIPGKTGAGKNETSSTGPIQLQGHGNPVFYQNIWIVTK